MPHPSLVGGSSAKVAIAYELTWTADKILDLLGGQAIELCLEPGHDEGRGIEFTLLCPNDVREFHSVKRQAPESAGVWSPAVMARSDARTGRSILSDMFLHLDQANSHSSVFVSQDGVRHLREISARARLDPSFEDPHAELSAKQREALDEHIVRKFADKGENWAADRLRRCEFKSVDHDELVRFVEHRVLGLVRQKNGTFADPGEVRRHLEEFAWQQMRETLRVDDILKVLDSWGLTEYSLSESADVRASIRDCNEAYRDRNNASLINSEAIPRLQGTDIARELIVGGPSVLLEGSAGEGKSSVLTQVAQVLESAQVPHLVLSMDEIDGTLTSRELGQRVGLPTSPAAVLGEISTLGRAVLCIDQIDDVSFARGRDLQGRRVLDQLISEATRYPELRILCACRTFDLEGDDGLSKLVRGDSPIARRVRIELLSHDEVRGALVAADIDPASLSEQQNEMLRTPLHLKLFVQAGPGREGFTDRQSLFDRYWIDKLRRVDALTTSGAFVQTISRLCDVMDQRESSLAPRFELTETEAVLDILASEGVVKLTETGARFFHDSFFGYSFVRSFLAKDVSIVDWLLAREQGFFRRHLTREIISFLRAQEPDEARYLSALSGVLGDERVRIHIKTAVLDWLSTLPNPTAGEWRLIEESQPKLGDHVWRVVNNSVPWFDRLDQLGCWEDWLVGDEELVDRAVMLLSRSNVLDARAKRAIGLVREHRNEAEVWRRRLQWLVHPGRNLKQVEIQELLLELIADGTLDEPRSGVDFWMRLYSLNKDLPQVGAVALGKWLDRAIAIADEVDGDNPFGPGSPLVYYDDISVEAISDCAARAPGAFVREVLSRFAELDQRVAHIGLWGPKPFGEPDRLLRKELILAMRRLARIDPDQLDSIIGEVTGDSLPSTNWTASIVLDAWTANPKRYAEHVVKTLLDRVESWLSAEDTESAGGMDTYVDVCRRALVAAAPHCSTDDLAEAENAILASTYVWEEQLGCVGLTQLRFLLSLPVERLSPIANRRKAELLDKFPAELEIDPPPTLQEAAKVSYEESPMSAEIQPPSTDAEWLAIILKYSSREPGFLPYGRFVGGSDVLARDLEAATRDDPERFVQLTSRMDTSIAPIYFEAVLRGLISDASGRHQEGDSAAVGQVLRRIRELGVLVRGAEVARAVAAIGHAELPDDIQEMLRNIALNDPSPEADTWPAHWRNPIDQAINSARGVAAEAIAQLLWYDQNRWAFFRSTVEQLVQDSVLAVRAVAVQCLSAVLRSDTKDALTLFARLVEGADDILGVVHIESFVHDAIFSDYVKVRPVLGKMLASASPEAVTVAARQITVASLFAGSDDAVEDAVGVLNMRPAARSTAAAIYARNLADESVTRECEKQLSGLFNDVDLSVRKAAATWWATLSADQIAKRGRLVRSYSLSVACGDRQDTTLFRRLQQAEEPLPVDVLAIAELTVERFSSRTEDNGDIDAGSAHDLAPVLLRLYQQRQDAAVRGRILNLVDDMIRLGFYGVDEVLQEHVEAL